MRLHRLLLASVLTLGGFFDSGCSLVGISRDDAIVLTKEAASAAGELVKAQIGEVKAQVAAKSLEVAEKQGEKLEAILRQKAEEKKGEGGAEWLYLLGAYAVAEGRKVIRDHTGKPKTASKES